jgi:hypothetical protein
MRLYDDNRPLNVLPEQERKIQRISSMDDLKEDRQLLECWQRTEWWLKKIPTLYSPRDLCPLHMLVFYSFPNFLFWFAAKLFPEDLRKCSTWGLPIHFCGRFKEKLSLLEKSQDIQFRSGSRLTFTSRTLI